MTKSWVKKDITRKIRKYLNQMIMKTQHIKKLE